MICGLECGVNRVSNLGTGEGYEFSQDGGKLTVFDLPDEVDTTMPVVIKLETNETPCIYKSGGYQNPRVPHCHYDPVPSEVIK